MTDCREQCWLFQDLGNRKVEVDFGGGYLSSDGGGLILRELERHSGLLGDFAGCFVDQKSALGKEFLHLTVGGVKRARATSRPQAG